MPKVSVVMSVYNGERYLREAVDSILNQTFTDFEFIIIDDDSTDSTWRILTAYAAKDSRMVLIRNEDNIGLTRSLNRGVAVAGGEYIARHDADDISLPERLATQVSYMELHRPVALISSGVRFIDRAGHKLNAYIPCTDRTVLRWRLLFTNPIRHPTVLWRRELVNNVVGHYDPRFVFAQDYELWVRVADHLEIGALPVALVETRRHSKSITTTENQTQSAFAAQVSHAQIVRYLANNRLTVQDLADVRAIPLRWFASFTASRFKQAAFRYSELWQQFCSAMPTNTSSSRALQREVERDLSRVLAHCQQQRWIGIGYALILFYLHDNADRTPAFIRPLLRMTVPPAWLSQYHTLRYGRDQASA